MKKGMIGFTLQTNNGGESPRAALASRTPYCGSEPKFSEV
jgi:hypothetical protein